jgi:surface-anchored protein
MTARRLTMFLVAAFALAALTPAREAEAALMEYTAGHLDIGVEYEDDEGELHLHYHFGGDAVLDGVMGGGEYGLDEVYIRVADSLFFPGAPLNLVGLGSGTGDAWVLPQTNNPGVPFTGLATEEVPLDFGSTRFQMSGFSGPGEFAVWTFGFGATIYWDTYGSGVDPTDYIDLTAGSHAHYAWGFTAPGVYYVDVLAQSLLNPGLSDTGTLIFVVGDSTLPPEAPNSSPVPEPTSLALLGMGTLAMGGGIFRRRRRNTTDAA